jgi:3-oxoacyl-[acyl-carrier protein] reductase
MSALNTNVSPTHHPDLAGKVAVVTGASRGIGEGTARALAENGTAVALIARDGAALSALATEIERDGGRALAVPADCTDEDQLGQTAKLVIAELGSPDILIPFAGGNGMPVATIEENATHWREVLDSDLTTTFVAISAFLPSMVSAGRGGAIVTMSSAAARQAARSSAAYAAAKAGVIALTRHLASELAPERIRVNCVAPSAIENDRMRQWMSAEQRQELGDTFPLGRIGQPADVAEATLYLASQASSWVTGITLDVAGGKIMV